MTSSSAEAAQSDSDIAAIVLAAGKSTRMRSKLPKALHPVCGKPILAHILDALAEAGVTRRIVVVGHEGEAVRKTLDARYGDGVLEYVEQVEQRGTGHAALMAQPLLAAHQGTSLIVPGDAPLLTAGVLRDLLQTHVTRKAGATLLTAVLSDAGAYGRVLRDPNGDVSGIVEARDASPEQREVREINTSVYAFASAGLFRALRDLKPNNAQGELYLTDAIRLLKEAGSSIAAVVAPDPDIVLGVNTRVELAEVAETLRRRLLCDLMLAGVSIVDPATTYVDAGVRIGQDTTLLPGTHLLGETIIGEECVIGPNAVLTDVTVGDRVRLRASFAEKSVVGDDCKIGPFSHLRPGSVLGRNVKVGNFVETKATTLGDSVSAGHLSYLGDAQVGADTNIGAGTITCNYDGFQKHRTTIGERTFIGSSTTLVAPVTVGDDAFTAAGSVITKEVPTDALAIARERQSVKDGWVSARRERQRRQREGGKAEC